MRMIGLTLSAIGLIAVAMSGCSNALNQPQPGQTPTAGAAPAQNSAGAPLVPANDAREPVEPSNQPAGQPLVPPTTPH
jgi:hypothetical protein